MSSNIGDTVEINGDEDEVDFKNENEVSAQPQSPLSKSPSILNNFYNKYVFNVDGINKSDKAKVESVKKAFDFNFVNDHSGESSSTLPSVSNTDHHMSTPEKSPLDDLKKKQRYFNSYIQDFEMPNVKAKEEALPSVAATRIISGVTVELPVVPYPAQLSVMDKVIKGIKNKENCLIESPTGSGKTLALLCSSLAWQKQERERVNKLIQESLVAAQNSPNKFTNASSSTPAKASPMKAECDGVEVNSKKSECLEESDDEDLFVKKAVKKTKKREGSEEATNQSRRENDSETSLVYKRKETSSDSHENGEMVSIHKKPKLSNSPNPNMAMCSSNSGCSPIKPHCSTTDEQQSFPKVPRIIFGTRTHKQIAQVIKELKRTVYSKNLKMSVLSSREHTCIKPLPKDFPTKTKHCKALMEKAKQQARSVTSEVKKTQIGSGCLYYDNKVALTRSRDLKDVWDIEDIVDLGKKKTACPYFAARDLADYAHIVFCPYNYIIDPIIRSSMQMNLEGDIILVDEGHNIEDTCRDSASLIIELKNIQECLNELEAVMKHKPLSKDDNNNMLLYFERYFKNWNDFFQNHLPLLQKQSSSESVYLLEGVNLADTLQKHSIGYNNFKELQTQTRQMRLDLKNSKPGDAKKRSIPPATGTLLESITLIFEYFYKDECRFLDNYNGIFTKRPNEWNKGKSESLSLKIACMDPSLVFSVVSSQARSVVLSSGTLTPMTSFPSELGTPFQHTLQARHVIKPDQVWVGTIESGPNGVPLESTYKNTSSTEWQDSLGDIILWISQKVPNGVLCFMSSYRLIETLQERWEATGLLQKLQEFKYVYTESKNMSEHDEVMTDFYSSVIEGAILFAVFRGKISEGMDFRDHQARAVITVGIPYANMKDSMVDGKMKYNNTHIRDRGMVSGHEWYSIQAFRALNQALGRCLRHKNDWGAIIMIDSRFKRDTFKRHISKWVQIFLGNQHHNWSSFTTGTNNLERFITYMQSQEQTDPDL